MTSSLGRLFDAVAYLLGLCDYNHSEAQAAMTLEAAARQHEQCRPSPYILTNGDGEDTPIQIDVRPMIHTLLTDLAAGESVNRMARAFHEMLITMLTETVRHVAAQTGLNRVVLSGGCFANRLLLEGMLDRLQREGLTVFIHRRVPTTDGGIALGQAVAAAERLARTRERQTFCHPERSEGSPTDPRGDASPRSR